MRDLAILFIHLLTTIARLMRPGGGRAVVAESLLVKHQLVILNRGRERATNLHPMGSRHRRSVYALHASEPPAPPCRGTEDVDPPRLPCCVGATQIPTLVLAEATRQARAQEAFVGAHRGHYRDHETQSELRLSSDRPTTLLCVRSRYR